jgi:hypothetical protein
MAEKTIAKKTDSKKTKPKKSSSKSDLGKTKGASLLKSLPESVEHIEIVQQVAGVLEELQNRVLDVKEEASKELKKLMKRYETNYIGLEKKVHKVTLEAKKQAQTSMIQLLQKWHEYKDKLPKPMAREIEKILTQIGTRIMASKAKDKKHAAPKKTAAKKAATKKTAKNKQKSQPTKKATLKVKAKAPSGIAKTISPETKETSL